MSKTRKQAETKDTLHVGLLIDESGSMGPMHGAVVGGINEFVAKLAADQNGTKVLATLGMFDLHGNDPVVRPKFEDIPVAEVATLGPDDYAPRGATPLNDAVVKTIRAMDKRVKKGHRAMLVILTDGLENSSETVEPRRPQADPRAREARLGVHLPGREPGRLGRVAADRDRRPRQAVRLRGLAGGHARGAAGVGRAGEEVPRRAGRVPRAELEQLDSRIDPGDEDVKRAAMTSRSETERRRLPGRAREVAAAAIRDAIEAVEAERPDLAERLRRLLERLESETAANTRDGERHPGGSRFSMNASASASAAEVIPTWSTPSYLE